MNFFLDPLFRTLFRSKNGKRVSQNGYSYTTKKIYIRNCSKDYPPHIVPKETQSSKTTAIPFHWQIYAKYRCCYPRISQQFAIQSSKTQARTLVVQLQTGNDKLNDCCFAIGAVETDQCFYGTARETIRHLLFHCVQWSDYCQELREKAARRCGDLSYSLGGKPHAHTSDERPPLDKDPWKPKLEFVRATIKFAHPQNVSSYRKHLNITVRRLHTYSVHQIISSSARTHTLYPCRLCLIRR